MAQKINVNMPEDLDLTSAWSVRVTAVDSSGAVVSGVKVSNMAITADTPNPATSDQLVSGPWSLVPGPGA